MKDGELKQISESWYIYKWKRNNKDRFSSGFGNDEEVAICGPIFYSKYQLKKSMKRGKCI